MSKNAPTRKRPRYTELQKITAVTAAFKVSPDHALTLEAIAAVHDVLGASVSVMQIRRWCTAYASKVEAQDDRLKVKDVDYPAVIENAITRTNDYERSLADDYLTVNRLALEALKKPGFISGSTDPRNIATVAGIATDKLLKLANLTGDVLDRLMILKELTPRKGYRLTEALDDLIHAYESMPDIGKAQPFTVDAQTDRD